MRRDFVCCLRIIVDSFPSFLRNSRLLFELSRVFFKLPPHLFHFRHNYKAGKISDLSSFYIANSDHALTRISATTDINSMHMSLLVKYFKNINPSSVLDAGCGSGYLINCLSLACKNVFFIGVDYQVPNANPAQNIDYRAGDLLNELQKIGDNSVDFVLCAHVIEHVSQPEVIMTNLKRIASKCLVIICPLEKEFRWGMNYHINFFPDQQSFSKFLSSNLYGDQHSSLEGVMYERLGDIMYVESYG